MEDLIDILMEGVKKFGGEIIAGILIAIVMWLFPSLRKIFSRKDDSEEAMKKLTEIQSAIEARHREEERLKEELRQREEALKQAEAQKAEESKRRVELQRELEAKQEALRRVEAQKAEEAKEAKRREEIERKRKFEAEEMSQDLKPTSHFMPFLLLFFAIAGTAAYIWIWKNQEPPVPEPEVKYLEIRAINNTWLSVSFGEERPVFRKTLMKGEAVSWDLKAPAKVVIARPKVAHIILNGEDLGIANPSAKRSETYLYNPDGTFSTIQKEKK